MFAVKLLANSRTGNVIMLISDHSKYEICYTPFTKVLNGKKVITDLLCVRKGYSKKIFERFVTVPYL